MTKNYFQSLVRVAGSGERRRTPKIVSGCKLQCWKSRSFCERAKLSNTRQRIWMKLTVFGLSRSVSGKWDAIQIAEKYYVIAHVINLSHTNFVDVYAPLHPKTFFQYFWEAIKRGRLKRKTTGVEGESATHARNFGQECGTPANFSCSLRKFISFHATSKDTEWKT